MIHVVWINPEAEGDFTVHFLLDSEFTLCGLAYEGVGGNEEQGFERTKKKVDCDECIRYVEKCKKVRKSEFKH